MKPRSFLSVPMHASLCAEYDALLDARSPAEYATDRLPGAVSTPVLDDSERARVGALYAQSPFAARRVGAALVARNIARLLETEFAGKPRDWRPLVYCWRGGKRSAALAHVLREVGWPAVTLEGGYKAYRRWVIARIAELAPRLHFVVLQGPTGAGKSRLLAALGRAGAQCLDLEALAAHRGSVLGALPGTVQPSQKRFESLLAEALGRFDPARPVYVEAESRRIGALQLPEPLFVAMRSGEALWLEAEVAVRAQILLEDYAHLLAQTGLLVAQLERLVALRGRERVGEWQRLAAAGAWRTLVERLLIEHYDPAYRRSVERHYAPPRSPRVLRVSSADAAAFDALAGSLA